MNKAVRIAMDITADYKYVYDPDHNSKPAGSWKQTGSGWSKHDDLDQTARSVVRQPAKKEERTIVKEAEPVQEPEEKAMPSAPEQKPVAPVKNEQPSEAEKKPETTEQEADAQPTEENTETPSVDTQAEGEAEKPDTPPTDEGDSLFDDGNKDGDGFETDESGKEEEQKEESPAEDAEEIQDEGLFDETNKDEYVNPDKYDENIEKMNSFIEKFDEGEGKENDVTFKAIAANLDWSSIDDVKAFADHCSEKGLDGADEVIAFLYFIHQDDEDKFNKIVEDMK